MKHHPFLEKKRKQAHGKICQKDIFLAKFWIDKKTYLKVSTSLRKKNIGFLTNRAGRNKIPYHEGNNSSPSGEAARGRIISQVVRNFIPTQAIGQESYSYEF